MQTNKQTGEKQVVCAYDSKSDLVVHLKGSFTIEVQLLPSQFFPPFVGE